MLLMCGYAARCSYSVSMSTGMLQADEEARQGNMIAAGKIFDAYLEEQAERDITPLPQLPDGHPDLKKASKLLRKLRIAENEMLNSKVERGLSFHEDGRLWYYSVGELAANGEANSVEIGTYQGLIATHNHPGRMDGRRTGTFSPTDLEVMVNLAKKDYQLQEFRCFNEQYLSVLQSLRPARAEDKVIARRMREEHPQYIGYSEEEREQLHQLLQELAPQLGLHYWRGSFHS